MGTPGLSIAIVEGGEIVFAKGYGIVQKGSSDKVDADTQFMIGSLSKSLTALMIASQVDNQVLDWNSRVVDLYPNFCVNDSRLTQRLVMENLLGACAGIPSKEFPILAKVGVSIEQRLFDTLATCQPITKLKETFEYSDELVAAAGFIAAYAELPAISMVDAYVQLMEKRVFGPLQMQRTNFGFTSDANRAYAHIFNNLEGETQSIPSSHSHTEHMLGNPTGGIWSTANDMAKYLQNEVNAGANCSDISAANLLYRRIPQVATSGDGQYALAWSLEQYRGITQVGHVGSLSGFHSNLYFYPDKACGVVVLSNDCSGVNNPICKKLLELWFGVDEQSEANLQFFFDWQQKSMRKVCQNLLRDDEWLQRFVGQHHNPELGVFSIVYRDGSYILQAFGADWIISAYDEDGQKIIRGDGTPLGFFSSLYPLENGSFALHEIHHKYVFVRQGESN